MKFLLLLILLSTLALFTNCNLDKVDDSDLCPNLPTASFTVSATSGNAPLSVTFTNTSTGGASSYLWDFGDGATATTASAVHTYTGVGAFEARLIATGSDGCVDTSLVRVITVSAVGSAPVANFTVAGANGVAPCTVTFNNTSSNAQSSAWDFGDGATSALSNPSHVFNEGGDFNVTLTVTGAGGATDDTTIVVHIRGGFKKIITEPTGAVQLANSNQRPAGDFHIMYYDGGYKSLILSQNGVDVSSITPYSFDPDWSFINSDRSQDGGFMLTGDDFGDQRVVAVSISGAQGVLWQLPFTYDNTGDISSGLDILQLANNEAVLCGVTHTTGNSSPGYARISSVGNFLNNTVINNVNTQYLAAQTIARKSSGGFILGCYGISPVQGAYLVHISQDGAYQNYYAHQDPGVTFIRNMVELSGDRYLVTEDAAGGTRYVEILDATGHYLTTLTDPQEIIKDYAVADDGNIVILRKEDGIRLTKVSGTDLTSVIWDYKFTESAGTLDPKKIFRAAEGGFFVSGTITNAGQTDLYVLKVDKNGVWE